MRAHAERAGTVADLKLAEAVAASAVDWFGLVLIIEPRAEHLTALPIFPMDIVGVARRIGIDARHPAASPCNVAFEEVWPARRRKAISVPRSHHPDGERLVGAIRTRD